MKIIKYDSDARLTDMINIFEASRKKFFPKAPVMDEEDLKLFLKSYWSKTVLKRDVLCVVTDEGKMIGVVGLYKPATGDNWFPLMSIYPEFETVELWDEMITAILNLAKEQNAPNLHFRASKVRPSMTQALLKRNIIPDHYIYSLHLENFENIPEISIPQGITIESTPTIKGKNQYISVMNEAYKDIEEWMPDTEENLREGEVLAKKRNFDMTYYLAYEGKTMVGACYVTDHPKDTSNRLIQGLGVQPKHRKKGIGEALMFTALKDLKAKGRKDVKWFVSGKDASDIKLPTKFGFQEIPKQTTVVYEFKSENM